MGTNVVLDMLERNYRLWCSQNDIELDDSPLAEGEEITTATTTDDMDVDLVGEQEEEEWNGFSDADEDFDDLPDFFKEMQASRKQKGAERKKRGRVHELVREKVRRVLEDETKLADRRAHKCDETDFLKLLYAFNKADIHFS